MKPITKEIWLWRNLGYESNDVRALDYPPLSTPDLGSWTTFFYGNDEFKAATVEYFTSGYIFPLPDDSKELLRTTWTVEKYIDQTCVKTDDTVTIRVDLRYGDEPFIDHDLLGLEKLPEGEYFITISGLTNVYVWEDCVVEVPIIEVD